MMVKRKLGGTVDKYSTDQEIHISGPTVHIPCEKFGGRHLAKPGHAAGRQSGRLAG